MIDRRLNVLASALSISLLVVLAGGCGSAGGSRGGQMAEATRDLELGQFRGEPAVVDGQSAQTSGGVRVGDRTLPISSVAVDASAAALGMDVPGVTVLAGPPDATTRVVDGRVVIGDAQSKPALPPVLLDAMVGQINGRPVYAAEILEPLDAELASRAKEVKNVAGAVRWVREVAGQRIRNRLEERVRSELLLAEAKSRLTPEQRAGLLPFLSRLRDFVSGQYAGSEALAEEALKVRGEQSLEKFLETEADKILIKQLAEEAIEPNVRVPWRSVERFYEENGDLFNPKPRGAIRLMQIDTNSLEAVAMLEAAKADPSKIDAFARSNFNGFQREKGGRSEFTLDQPIAQLKLFGPALLNEAAGQIAPGQWLGPIELVSAADNRKNPFQFWMYREPDNVIAPKSLEEAQLAVIAALTKSKRDSETNAFFKQVLGRGSYTPLGKMTLELVLMATERHLGAEVAAEIRKANPLEEPVQRDAGSLGR